MLSWRVCMNFTMLSWRVFNNLTMIWKMLTMLHLDHLEHLMLSWRVCKNLTMLSWRVCKNLTMISKMLKILSWRICKNLTMICKMLTIICRNNSMLNKAPPTQAQVTTIMMAQPITTLTTIPLPSISSPRSSPFTDFQRGTPSTRSRQVRRHTAFSPPSPATMLGTTRMARLPTGSTTWATTSARWQQWLETVRLNLSRSVTHTYCARSSQLGRQLQHTTTILLAS